MFIFGIPVTQKRKIIQHFEASSNLVKMIGTQLARVYKFSTRSDKRSKSSQPPKSVITDGNNNIDAASSNDDDKNNHDHENYNHYYNGEK